MTTVRMSGRRISVLLVAALAGAGILWLLRDGAGRGLPQQRVEPNGEVASEKPAEPRETPATAAPSAPAELAASARTQVPAKESVAEPWTVRITRRGAAAAGVGLACVAPESAAAVPRPSAGDLRESFRLLDKGLRSDASGELRLEPVRHGSLLIACDGQWTACHEVRGDESSPIELSLELDLRLSVRVTDEGGHPLAGVPVARRVVTGSSSSTLPDVTGADGTADFRARAIEGMTEASAVLVSVQGVFGSPIEKRFGLADWPADPVELVLAPHGSITVELVDASGERVELLENIALEVPRKMTLQLEGDEPRAPGIPASFGAEAEGGVARFGPVELGRTFTATMDGRPQRGVSRRTFAGPTFAGEELEVQLVVEPQGGGCSFRALDPAGAPLSVRKIQATRTHAGDDDTAEVAVFAITDDAGRTRLSTRDFAAHASGSSTVSLQVTTMQGARLEAEFLLPEPPTGEYELGDVRFHASNTLVSGRVVDGAGQPVANVGLRVERAAAGSPERWTTLVWTSSAADGSFAAYKDAPATSLRLLVQAQGYAALEPIAFSAGASALRIELTKAATAR